MRIILLILLFYLFSFQEGFSQTYFNKKYDLGGGNDVSQSIVTIDSGYVVCANGYHATVGYLGVCLLFLDFNGDTLYSKWVVKQYYGYYDGWGGAFRKYSNGGFYMGGGIEDTAGTVYAMLYRFDENGDTLWTKKYGNGNDFYSFNNARETSDNGFILTGSRTVGSNLQGLLIKTDSLGNIQWQQHYGGSGRDAAVGVLPLSDGKYIMGGSTETQPCGNVLESAIWAVRANANGTQNWTDCYGGQNEENGAGYPAFEFPNGDIAMVSGYAAPFSYPYIMRISSSGVIQYQKYIGYPIGNGDGYLHSAIQGLNNDILAVGTRRPPGPDYGLFMRYDEFVDSTWYLTYQYGSNSINELWDIDTAHGGGYVMCGTTNQSSVQDVWVIKVDEHGCLNDPDCWYLGPYEEEEKWSVGISEMEKEDYFSVFPNPNNGKFFIESKIGIISDLEIKIYNPLGEFLFSSTFINTKTEIDLTEFSNGIYFITVDDDGGVLWKSKVVKE